jgi:Ca-activated chloride channel family protein
VTIPLTVIDSEGRRVTGLTQADFKLEEDGVEQEISIFSAERQPVAISLLVDYSGSMSGDRIDAALSAVRAVGEAMTDSDQWSISAFADRYRLAVPWARFDDLIFQKLRQLVPGGGTRLFDAVVRANADIATAPLRKRAILLISDGNDLSSQIGSDFSADLDSLTYAGAGESAATAALRRGETLLYAFGMDWPYRPQRTGARGPSERIDRSTLERLAHPTGGVVWMPKSRQELIAAASELMVELREQYTLGYSPRQAADGRYRRLKVISHNPENRVRHRTGYVASARR